MGPDSLPGLLFFLCLDSWPRNKGFPFTEWLIQVQKTTQYNVFEASHSWWDGLTLFTPISLPVWNTGPGLTFIAYPQATAMMPFPQFWTICFFLMLLLLSVDTHVMLYVVPLINNNHCICKYLYFQLFARFILSPVCEYEVFYHFSERLVSYTNSHTRKAWDLCPRLLFILLSHTTGPSVWGEEYTGMKEN